MYPRTWPERLDLDPPNAWQALTQVLFNTQGCLYGFLAKNLSGHSNNDLGIIWSEQTKLEYIDTSMSLLIVLLGIILLLWQEWMSQSLKLLALSDMMKQ